MSAKKKGFEPTFENGGFWEYYSDLERQFTEYLAYVPYLEGNEGTYSFRLANLILSIGAHLDSALKEIGKDSTFSKYSDMNNPKNLKGKPRLQNVFDFYPISEVYSLPTRIVTFKCLPNKDKLEPFKDYNRESGNNIPYWWTSYNNIKHHFYESFKEAQLKTIRDALAGAFLINAIHKPSRKRLFDNHLLQPKYQQGTTFFEPYNDSFDGQVMYPTRDLRVTYNNPFTLETALFTYDYEEPSTRK